MVAVNVRVEGLRGVVQTLHELPPELVSKRGGPVRSALRKAGKRFQDRMKANIQKIIDDPNVTKSGHIIPTKSIGLAVENVILTRQKMPPGVNGERYKIGPRLRKTYPEWRAGNKTVSVVQVLRLLETGTENRKPYPWARPAFDAEKHAVIGIFVVEINAKLQTILRKLAAKNGVA